jgi:hypothetical protein
MASFILLNCSTPMASKADLLIDMLLELTPIFRRISLLNAPGSLPLA